MESGSGSGVAEAERWLTIAAKLLAARDLHGTRTFAIRARESDPRYEGSSQVLAVADTLLAGDSLVNNQPDWYAVLQLNRFTQDPELIATQYRKLALLINPVRTRLAFADQALKLVYEAWSVLSNSSKKLLYDNQLQLSQLGQLGQLGQPQPLPPQMGNQQTEAPSQQRPPQTPSRQPQPQTPSRQPQPQTPSRQPQPQTPTPVRRSPRNKDGTAADDEGPSLTESTRPARPSRTPEVENRPIRAPEVENHPIRAPEAEIRPIRSAETDSEPSSFWTACPYCYVLYEYPKVYEECTLRCQNCRRAFHAAVIPTPPVEDGKNSYFCSWGFFPLGFSGNAKGTGGSANWSPISGMFACPLQGDGKPPASRSNPLGKRGPGRPRKTPFAAPKPVYHDDNDVFIDISDPSDDSNDGEWRDGGSNRKKAKNVKGKGLVGRPPKKAVTLAREGEVVIVHALSADANRNLVANTGKKQSTKVAKDLGKLDLNVEFSTNDVEEAARSEGNGGGNGEEDNIEGIGFFEGLEEFLSSLPILSVVGDDKVKAS